MRHEGSFEDGELLTPKDLFRIHLGKYSCVGAVSWQLIKAADALILWSTKQEEVC